MRFETGPPLYAPAFPDRPVPGRPEVLVHAEVWARHRIDAWNVATDLHLRLLARRSEDGTWRWSPADLSRCPFAAVPPDGLRAPADPDPPPAALESLERWIREAGHPVHRFVPTGTVSEPGEPLDAFRRRVLGEALRAALAAGDGARPAAAGIARLRTAFETRRLPLLAAVRLRVAVATLVAADPGRLLERSRPGRQAPGGADVQCRP